ncbi:juvenile hormone esterase-like [Chrysoperla carnea]|uniref:juvenile hormone esterase-like n=1 Tax=Chrysoperla carnea TaxID=189513 RepID=UPI001D08AF84|nr:juvenile hormone esterase-like [Chrysoperla carnea]
MTDVSDVILEIEQGKLCGRIAKDLNGSDYKSFQGIPYAKPPVGNLRFKAPEPPEPWEDEIFDAKVERSPCYQSNFRPGEKFIGSEDCLFLNVFTPKLPDESPEKLPVMVFIHHGGFFAGSSSADTFGPEFLVAKNIVLVTFNYRLGFLGFLCLKDPTCEVTGNAGLKDQTAALRWVQKNISAFGGDKNNVTIFGESSGGVSVTFHLLSPLSKGLFHKAISQSGTALDPWALQVRHDYEFIHLLDCKSTDDREILKFLQNQKLEDIMVAQRTVAAPEAQAFCEFCDASPNVEPNIPSAFITDTPENLLREGRFNQVPTIIGLNDKEGLLMNSTVFNVFKKCWFDNGQLVPGYLQEKLEWKQDIENANNKIKEFYKITDIESTTDYWTDVLFAYKIAKFTKALASKSNQPVYYYLFRISIDSMKMESKIHNWEPYDGAAHTEELPYLFKQILTPEILPGTPEELGIHIMTTLWTNFAKSGNPNPVESDHINIEWKPFTPYYENYLDIDLKPQLKHALFKERIQFWDSLCEQ